MLCFGVPTQYSTSKVGCGVEKWIPWYRKDTVPRLRYVPKILDALVQDLRLYL